MCINLCTDVWPAILACYLTDSRCWWPHLVRLMCHGSKQTLWWGGIWCRTFSHQFIWSSMVSILCVSFYSWIRLKPFVCVVGNLIFQFVAWQTETPNKDNVWLLLCENKKKGKGCAHLFQTSEKLFTAFSSRTGWANVMDRSEPMVPPHPQPS